ncbi:MAG: alpha/beta hydrolase [Elusimicrobia bacterium]|nr:alpha/beta hydrolase [Elusimicrobiota bacterium]
MEKNINFKSGRYNLSGVLHIPDKGKQPYPIVVMFHGFTGHKAESHFLFTKTARVLSSKGIGVLRFDFMGSGDSEGKFENMTLHTQIQNGKHAIEFIKADKRFDKERIGVIGLSMGAIIATFTATEYKTRALILWSPLAYPELTEQKILTADLKKTLLKNGKVYPPGLGHFLSKKFFDSVHKIKPIETAELYKGNVLLFHTTDDATLPIDHAYSYFKAFHNRAVMPRFIILAEGGHTFTTEFSEKTVIEETSSFLIETLF